MNPKNNLPPVHPGEFLKENLDELRISQAEFARTIGLSAMRISHVVKGKRPVTAEMALLFGKAFGQTPQYWRITGLQELPVSLAVDNDLDPFDVMLLFHGMGHAAQFDLHAARLFPPEAECASTIDADSSAEGSFPVSALIFSIAILAAFR